MWILKLPLHTHKHKNKQKNIMKTEEKYVKNRVFGNSKSNSIVLPWDQKKFSDQENFAESLHNERTRKNNRKKDPNRSFFSF
jgi:hypothetical protein